MTVKLLTALFVIVLLAGAVFYDQNLTPQNMPSAAPNAPDAHAELFPAVTFTAPDGKSFHLTDLKEPVVLVHFWAAWCAVCHTEFADLLEYVDHSGGKVALIAVALDDNYADSRKVLEQAAATSHENLNAPHLYWAWDKDKSLSLRTFNTVKVPETIIVKNGMMVNKIIGVAPWAEASGVEASGAEAASRP